MKRSSSDHIENSCWSIAQRTRGFDSRLLRVLVSATDVKPAAVGTAGRSIAFFSQRKSRQTDGDRMQLFSSGPDRAQGRRANTAAAAAVPARLAARPCRQPLFNS